MPKSSHVLVAQVLRQLGHTVPPDSEIEAALKKAFIEVKKANGQNPDKIKLKMGVPIDIEWIREVSK
jgi:hypothetical protein